MHALASASRGLLLIIGASTRAAAQSALRAGYTPICIDLFADRDLKAIAPVRRCAIQQYPLGILDLLPAVDLAPGRRASATPTGTGGDRPNRANGEGDFLPISSAGSVFPQKLPAETPVLFTGAMENHLEVVRFIETRFPLLGPSSAVMAAVRQPDALSSMPPCPGLKMPAIAWNTAAPAATRPTPVRWLRKPVWGTGGRGIREASAGDEPDERHYFQEFISGLSLGAVFTAHSQQAQLVGASLQIIGDRRFHAPQPFHYVGSIGPLPLSNTQHAALLHLGNGLVARLGLRGLFGVDLILDAQGNLWPIEINPRYPASVEVHERTNNRSVLADPWASVVAPSKDRKPPVWFGKAIAYFPADSRTPREGVSAPDLYRWFTPGQIADVPEPGEPLLPRHPICTLQTTGSSSRECLTLLHQLADQLYHHLGA